MPKYSFVIPAYNCQQYLEECVESVLKQTIPDLEVLLVDDESTDGSGALCERLRERDGRIRVFHKENGGAASARNLGIEEACGRYLLFVDGDDTIDPTCLEEVEPALGDERCLPVFGMCFEYWRNNQIVKTEFYSTAFPGLRTVEEIAENLPEYFEDNVLSSACNKVFPAKLLRDNKIRFPESMMLYEDLAFVLECVRHIDRICVIPQGFYHYRNQAEGEHFKRRVADLDVMRENLAPLNRAFREFGEQTGQIGKSDFVSTDLYISILEMHLLSIGPGISTMREKLPRYIAEEGFRAAMDRGADPGPEKRRLVERIEQGKFLSIWMEYAGKRMKRAVKTAAKRILRR